MHLAVLSCLAALAAPAPSPVDHGSPGETFQLALGPIFSGSALVFDLRTTVPGGAAWVLLGIASSSLPAAGSGPALGLGTSVPIPVVLDGTGRLRVELPTHPQQFLAAAGLSLMAQGVVFTQAGELVASPLAASRFEPAGPVGPFLTSADATQLPAAAATLGDAQLDQGDFDRDGLPDLIVARAAGIDLWVQLGDRFVEVPFAVAHPGGAIWSIAVGDLDGDGFDDLVTGADGAPGAPGVDRVWLGTSTATLDLGTPLPPGTAGATALELGDVDLDGDLDLVRAQSGDPHGATSGALDQLLINDGSGQFAVSGGFVGPWNDLQSNSTSVSLGDVDSDGDLDLAIGKSDISAVDGVLGARNVLLLNDGAGSYFESIGNFADVRFDNTNGLQFADVDGDGDLDLVAANSLLAVSAADSGDLWINQGRAQAGVEGVFCDFADAALEDATGSALRLGVEAGDIDADGDVDLWLSVHELGSPGDRQPLWINQGGGQGGTPGSFALQDWFAPGEYIAGNAEFIDFGLDGDLDLLQPAAGAIGPEPAPTRLRFFENHVL